jgi:hypothetical protein
MTWGVWFWHMTGGVCVPRIAFTRLPTAVANAWLNWITPDLTRAGAGNSSNLGQAATSGASADNTGNLGQAATSGAGAGAGISSNLGQAATTGASAGNTGNIGHAANPGAGAGNSSNRAPLSAQDVKVTELMTFILNSNSDTAEKVYLLGNVAKLNQLSSPEAAMPLLADPTSQASKLGEQAWHIKGWSCLKDVELLLLFWDQFDSCRRKFEQETLVKSVMLRP